MRSSGSTANWCTEYLFGRMILTEKSATFRDRAQRQREQTQMKSMTRWKAAWFAGLVAAAGLHADAASAQLGYKIGISGAATGPASPSYLPHIEGLRIYLSQLNDKG